MHYAFLKRLFDITVSLIGLLSLGWLIAAAFVIAAIDTRKNGFFIQQRIGRYGRPFKIIKLRTMRSHPCITTDVTVYNDPRITQIGRILRSTKLDELPQLINVLLGQMSLVGPRPDVPGFADHLTDEDRIILSVRPGITGPATLRFRHEEKELTQQENPESYNRTVIFPQKVKLNREYIKQYRFTKDLKYLLLTIFGSRFV